MSITSFLCIFLVSSASLFSQTGQYIKPKVNYNQSELLYGIVVTPEFYEKEHPFLLDGDFNQYQLYYKDFLFDSIRMRYNIHEQSLVYYQEVTSSLPRFIKLNPNYVKKIVVRGDKRSVVYKSANQYKIPDSKIRFYNVKYENHLSYIVGYQKAMTETYTHSRTEYTFNKQSKHYIIYKGKAHRIKRPRDIYKLFEDKKRELKTYKKQNNLKLRPKAPQDIIKLIRYYEQIEFN